MEKRSYPSDLSNQEGQTLEPLFRDPPRRGRKRKWPIRIVLNAIFYTIKTGCQWRYLPTDFPPWQTVFYHFRQWRRRGEWFKVHEALREATRKKAGRHPDPSAAVLDSQSVKTTAEGARPQSFDGNKKVKGRKQRVLVDTLGLLLSVYTTPANVGDRWGAKACLGGKKLFLPRLKRYGQMQTTQVMTSLRPVRVMAGSWRLSSAPKESSRSSPNAGLSKGRWRGF